MLKQIKSKRLKLNSALIPAFKPQKISKTTQIMVENFILKVCAVFLIIKQYFPAIKSQTLRFQRNHVGKSVRGWI